MICAFSGMLPSNDNIDINIYKTARNKNPTTLEKKKNGKKKEGGGG